MDSDEDLVPEATTLEAPGSPAQARWRSWQVYLYALATFGLFLPYWTWFHGKRAMAEDRNWATPYLWAAGSLMPPVAWAILYDLEREAVAKRSPGRWRVPAGLPAALCILISILGIVGPLQAMMVGWLVLVPLPFMLVQGIINASAIDKAPRPRRSTALRATIAAGTTLGLATFLGTVYMVDGSAIARLGAGRIAEDSVVRGAAAAYELQIPTRGWQRVAAGTYSDDEADVELGGPGQLTWVVVYVSDAAVSDIDGTVNFRRNAVFSDGTPAAFEEQRYFLNEESYVPVSVADYEVTFPLTRPDYYVVLTTELGETLIEVVGYTGEPHRLEGLRELVLSFRLTEPAGDEA